jgi:RimJ/RimL family protein N-acetyltransferase
VNIFHPNGPMRGVERDSCFIVQDDAGVEIGQGCLIIKPMMDLLPERPLNLILDLEAHPSAMDMLYGALMVRARMVHQRRGSLPARVVVPCALTDALKHDYFLAVGFDDTDGEELFRFAMPERLREMPPPLGTGIISIPLRLQADTEALVLRMNRSTGETWSLSRFEGVMNTAHFMALAVYSGEELCGEIVISGQGPDAMIEALYVASNWRRQGVAMALLSHALTQLAARGVQFVYARAIRRNTRALSFLSRMGFEWVMTRQLLLGRDLNREKTPAAPSRAFSADPFAQS